MRNGCVDRAANQLGLFERDKMGESDPAIVGYDVFFDAQSINNDGVCKRLCDFQQSCS